MLNLKALNTTEELSIDKEVIDKRNQRLKEFFEELFGKRFLIIGNPNTPSVIYFPEGGTSKCLSCFVHNFHLVFTSQPFEGEHLHTVVLSRRNIKEMEKEKIMDIINSAQHRTVFRIRVKNTNLYLSGYNFKDKTDYETKYPVFAPFGEKIYFNVEHAAEVAETYSGYNLEVVAH